MPIDVVGLDAETFYSQEYSLSKMTTQEYIEDKNFQEIMWAAARVGSSKVAWQIGRAEGLLAKIDWDNTIMLAHNAQFDGAILDEHHGIRPKRLICTMALGRTLGIHKITGSVSLANMATFLKVGTKGAEVGNMRGRRLESLSQQDILRYKKYNKNDVVLMNKIFEILRPHISDEEMIWNSTVNKMYTEPTIQLNTNILKEELGNIIYRRRTQQIELCKQIGYKTVEEVKKALGSAELFAGLLRDAGAEIPMKQSPTTGKLIYAFAKTDQGMMDLLEHDDPKIKQLAETRIGVKSNTEQTRIERLLLLSGLPSGKFRIPHKISGAHTHRLSGQDSLNIQNFPSGRIAGQSKAIRHSIEPVQGHLTAPDSGQIEARILSFIANDEEMLDIFATGKCPYSEMASKVYPYSAADVKAGDGAYKQGDADAKKYYMARQTGKGAVLSLGFGTGFKGLHRALTTVYQVEDITERECQRIHTIYRNSRPKVVRLWGMCERILDILLAGGKGTFGGPDNKLFVVNGLHETFGYRTPGIKLPNGTWLTYPGIYKRPGKTLEGGLTGYDEYAYFKNLKNRHRATAQGVDPIEAGYKHGTRVWWGTLVENFCQSLAFAVLKWQGNHIAARMPVAFNVHDEFIITGSDKNAALAQRIMETSPPWVKAVKFECEYKLANNYGDT